MAIICVKRRGFAASGLAWEGKGEAVMPKTVNEPVSPQDEVKRAVRKQYIKPAAVAMGDFSARTALGVSPAMKKKDNYVVSVLF